MWFLSNMIVEAALYLIVDNITKVVIVTHRKENRFDILLYECLLLGFLIGSISVYYHIPYLLICLLCVHIFGTLHTEQRFNTINASIRTLIVIFGEIARWLFHRFYTIIANRLKTRDSPSPVLITKKLPEKYLYNYHLKPSKSVSYQQPTAIQSLSRPGLFNLHGTTCSLNALLQSLASLNTLCTSLQRNTNLSRITYDPIVPTFLDLLVQLRTDHHISQYKHWNTSVDPSLLVSRLNLIYPALLTRHTTTDLAELFQCLIDALNTTLAKQTAVCSTNVLEQVHNRKLTTFSLDYLNKIFLETEAQLHHRITLSNLDAQASYIIQYVDLTWLLHQIQLGSVIKHTFSGQLLHAHCCDTCSHVRFRTEPFQILPLPVNQTNTTLERLIGQLTEIEIVDSVSCSYCCSSRESNDHQRESTVIKHGTLLTKIASTLSPLFTTRPQPSGQILPSIIPSTINTRVKSQTMIANFPDVLCIQLKRFSYDHLSRTTTKLSTSISIESEKILDLSHVHYTTWLGLANLSTTVSSRYRLMAVCLHLSGSSSRSGHYVCLYRLNHSRWFLSDDEHITEINPIDHVFQTSYVKENCYLLFYERCS